MSAVENFLSYTEEQEVIAAIREAEKNTSGEIRVHLENSCDKSIEDRTKAVFHYLKMDNTKLQNGVLIYVAVNNRQFSIYGDQGINKVVSKEFWNSTKEAIQTHFISGNFKQGLIEGIIKSGKQLEQHFPWEHTDINELPNQISKGE
ncbi:TPM domain-containing protein [Ichthyenterobacterium sp. W332]|uniref:TPM domain-containing protein n=1 Tax=Microcosmobacter mediterraneus TaxID=3075607 RepID=A0ABU2YG15_9FLAO|nr:TPM domain-containing protein [Ichthyenterobacterium sp. W332]MDT0557101.1 TPM domain-containing protein [Ichthyenterobacterium sp. W332]